MMLHIAVWCFSAIFFLANPLKAQVRFATPEKVIDLSRYNTFEECMSLQSRLNRQEKRHLPYWKDSLEYPGVDKLHPASDPVRDTLTLCMSKFSPSNVDYNNYTDNGSEICR